MVECVLPEQHVVVGDEEVGGASEAASELNGIGLPAGFGGQDVQALVVEYLLCGGVPELPLAVSWCRLAVAEVDPGDPERNDICSLDDPFASTELGERRRPF